MKKIKGLIAITIASILLSYSLKAQEIKRPQQLYMQATIGGNSLAGLPNNSIEPSLSYSFGLSNYIYQNLFWDVAAELRFKGVEFDAMLQTPEYSYEGIRVYNLGINIPVTIGKSFIINETNQQVDFKGGLYVSAGLFSRLSTKKVTVPVGLNSKGLYGISAYNKGKDDRNYTSRFNMGLSLSSRYWVLPQLFIVLDGKIDFFNNILSEDIRIKKDNEYSYSPNRFGSRNFNISIGVGYSF